MNYKESIAKFVTAEVRMHGEAKYFAKLASGQWVAVNPDGGLDWAEINPVDLESMLETFSSVGAQVRFTNHSAA